MASLKIVFNDQQAGPALQRKARGNKSLLARSLTQAARDAAVEILDLGRADMKAAGNFGSLRWQQGLHADVIPKQGAITNPRIRVFHDQGAKFGIFEFGGVIHGKPMLWIPLSYTGIKIRAREYGRRYGLFRVIRKRDRLPLLLSMRDRKPKYFGKESVRIPRKFHIRDITAKVANRMTTFYRKALARLKANG